MADSNTTPQYLRNSAGHLVPIDIIAPIDLARDELVREIVAKARELNTAIATFKAATFADIGAFVELSAEKYGAKLGGNKGNIQLVSFDGRYKVLRAIAERISFDERLQAAKALIEECIDGWTENSSPEVRALITGAFQVDKAGNISTARVLGLRRLEIEDERWQRAMAAISDAIQIVATRSYVRVYERKPGSDEYQQIALDIAAV